MPKSKPMSLSAMLDTDGEEDIQEPDAFPTPDSNQENVTAGKKRGGRPKANARKFTKIKRLSGESVTAKASGPTKAKAGRKRAPLKDSANEQQMDQTEEVDEFARSDPEVPAQDPKKPKPAAKRKAASSKGGRPAKKPATKRVGAIANDGEFEYTPTSDRRARVAKDHEASDGKDLLQSGSFDAVEVPETQLPHGINTPGAQKEADEEEEPQPTSVYRRTKTAQATSRQQKVAPARRRAGSASDTDRAISDPALRRRLGDMTRKFENIDLKYRNLKESGLKEAEANYDRLKKQSEINSNAANDLIASLKKEITVQKAIAKESQSFQNQVQSRDADLAKTRTLADDLSRSLSDAQNENKVLQAKLANLRIPSTAVDRTPGSTMRGRQQAHTRQVAAGGSDTARTSHVAQLKEDLYSDLTGLIVRGVDISNNSDTFDCIQTGRNGTLHFKLAVAKESDDSYEDTEFQYMPRLDDNRDRDLIALLPEYLAEDISFSRMNAAMFYGRVIETLTKRRPVEGSE